MRPFLSRYPRFLSGSAEFCDLQQALEPELLALWSARDGALAQLCVETATWGLQYWERTLGIPVEEEKDLNVRRSRVKARLLGTEVTTVELLRRMAEGFAGGSATVTEYPERFLVELGFPGVNGIPQHLRELVQALREIMPAHLGWGLDFQCEMDAALHVSAYTEVSASADIWPQLPTALESIGGIAAGGAVEYHYAAELWPIKTKEEYA